MAITITQRGAVNNGTDSAAPALASCVLTSGKVYLALIHLSVGSGGPPTVSSVAGTGLSMTKFTTTGDAETLGVRRVELWYGICTASGTVTVTATYSTTSTSSDFVLYELDGVKTTGTNGVDAIVQGVCDTQSANTALSFTGLAAFASADNRPLAFMIHAVNEATAHDSGSGYTELLDAGHNTPPNNMCIQWHSSSADTDPDFSWSTSAAALAIAVELAAAVAAAGQAPRSMHQFRQRAV